MKAEFWQTDIYWTNEIFEWTRSKADDSNFRVQLTDEALAWCKTNEMFVPFIKRSPRIRTLTGRDGKAANHAVYELFFASEEDAALFKLKWQ